MDVNVHYLPIRFGYKHYVEPLDSLPVDKAVLLIGSNASTEYIEPAEDELTDNDINVAKKTIPTDDFHKIVAEGYDDLREVVTKDGHVYINTSSIPWTIGYGYAIAAGYLIAESRRTDNADNAQVAFSRNDITLYHTEPAQYRHEDLLTIAQQAQKFRDEFERSTEDTQNLLKEVKTDRDMMNGFVEILDDQEDDPESLTELQFFETIKSFTQEADSESIGEAFNDSITGVEQITNGINTLCQEENRETLEKLETIAAGGSIADVSRGLRSLGERPDSQSSSPTAVDMFKYLKNRLDNVERVLNTIEVRYSDLEDESEKSSEEASEVLSTIESDGIAQGFNTFGDKKFLRLPDRLELDIKPLHHAILYTLYEEGKIDSVQNVIIDVLKHAIRHTESERYASETHDQIKKIKNRYVSTQDEFIQNQIFPTLKTKFQNAINELERRGFVNKKYSSPGREIPVELTDAGEIYTIAHLSEELYLIEFNELREIIESEL